MDYTVQEVLQFVEENDVKFIRLTFCDIFGTMKNISIMATELSKAFQTGISFDASAVRGFMNVEESDLLLFPDSTTLTLLPWRPQEGQVVRFFCEIRHPDGTVFEGDSRHILKQAVMEAEKAGFTCKVGPECEFYLFEADDTGKPTKIPHDDATYLDVAPLDKGENVRREICLTLEEMGFHPENSHHEQGPGQNEIDFKYTDALMAADNVITFKTVVKTVAARNGLYASFMPKPLYEQSGSGMHINLSLSRNGFNIFKNKEEGHCKEAEHFLAGIMARIPEITLFLNPLTNSYQRLGQCAAPKYVTWSHQNRSQLVRIPAAKGEFARMELRSADPSCNPYVAFALLIYAGLEGIVEETALDQAFDFNMYTVDSDKLDSNIQLLPATLKEAIQLAQNSDFVKKVLPIQKVAKLIETKWEEWEQYSNAEDKEQFETNYYFKYI